MPIVHTRRVTYVSAGRRRHPGSAAADINEPYDNSVTESSTYSDWTSPQLDWTDADHVTHPVQFAFWAVTGGANGPVFSTDTSLHVPVGSEPVQATAWYLPTGGGNGEPMTYIDAFDLHQGTFVDDDFVTVSPDADLSAQANEVGLVPTHAAEQLQAWARIHGVPFKQWQLFAVHPVGADSVEADVVHTGARSSAFAFAFYERPAEGGGGPLRIPSRVYEAGTWVSFGVKVDGGGPTGNGPVPPWEAFIRELAASLTMAYVGAQGPAETRVAAASLAAKQLTLSAEKIGRAMVESAKTQLKSQG